MKILQWNIHAWTDEDFKDSTPNIITLITDLGPDLVSLNEVNEGYCDYSLLRMAKQLEYYYVFVPSLTYYLKGKKYRFGNVILSKHLFSAVESFTLTPATFVYDGNEKNEPRSITWLKLLNQERLGWFGSTHLPRADHQVRATALRNLADTIPDRTEKIVLAGDFNTGDKDMGPYFTGAVIVPRPPEVTYSCRNPREAIDHFVLWNIRSYNCRVIKNKSTDHFPLLLEI